jgi:putative PIN family toxin of toxin-antitoxin system
VCSETIFTAAHKGRLGLILDTNIVLDAFVFNDPATQSLKDALAAKKHQWISTQAMRDELERVLAYPKIVLRMAFYQVSALEVLAQFDRQTQLHEVAPKAPVTCRDPDDQKFIDLAVTHKAILLSKDNAVLCMAKRLSVLDVAARGAF